MRPRHDPVPKVSTGLRAARDIFDREMLRRNLKGLWRRPPKRDPGGQACPVEPNRPLDLSGGAAAALSFDD